jgi:hypothetical protein
MSGQLLGAIIGFFVGLLAAVAYEWLRRPRLRFRAQVGEIDSRPVIGRYRFVSVIVCNHVAVPALRPFSRNAHYARAFVHFRNRQGDDVLLDDAPAIDGRWGSGPEPVDYASNTLKLELVVIPQREIVVIDEAAVVNIAVRFDRDQHGFAFNNRSYLAPPTPDEHWRLSGYELQEDPVFVRIRIVAEGVTAWSPTFRLQHGGPFEDVSLVEVSRKEDPWPAPRKTGVLALLERSTPRGR